MLSPEEIKQRQANYFRKYYLKNKEKILKKNRLWAVNNADKLRSYQKLRKCKICDKELNGTSCIKYCRECKPLGIKQYYDNYRKTEQYKKLSKARWKKNKHNPKYMEWNRQGAKNWYSKNKDKMKQYREVNADKINSYSRNYYKLNKEKINQKLKQYRKNKKRKANTSLLKNLSKQYDKNNKINK